MLFGDGKEHPVETLMEGVTRRLLSTGEKIQVFLLEMKGGVKVPEHAHVNEQASYMVKGRFEVKHLGSYANHMGAKKAEIVRLFEFENLSAWNKFMEVRESMFRSEQGKQAFQTTIGFVHDIEESTWISVY